MKRIYQELEESREAGKETLKLEREDFERYSGALDWDIRKVSALYKRLVLEGYVRQYKDEKVFHELGGVISVSDVEDLTDKGLREIQVLPDPNERLAASMDAFVDAIWALEDVPEQEKERAEKAAQEIKHFTRGLAQGAALQAVRALAAHLGVPLT